MGTPLCGEPGSGVQTTVAPSDGVPRATACTSRRSPANSRTPEKGSPVSLQQVKQLRHECSSGRNRHSSSRQTAALAPRQTAHRSDRKWKRKRPRALARGSGKRVPRARPTRHPSRDSPHGESHRTRGRLAFLRRPPRRSPRWRWDLHAAANLPAGPAELAILPAGRANNVARALGVLLDLKAAAELAAEGQPRWIDLINATTDRPATAPSKGSASACTRSLGRATARRTQPILPPRPDRPSGRRERSTESRSVSATACPRCSPSASSSSPTSPSTPSDCVLPRRPAGRRSPPRGQPPVGRTGASHPDDRATSARDTPRPPWHTQLDGAAHQDRDGGKSPLIADTTNLGTGPVTLDVDPSQRFQWWRHEHRDPRPPLQSARKCE